MALLDGKSIKRERMKIELKSYDVASLYVIGIVTILFAIMGEYLNLIPFIAGIFAIIGKSVQDKKAKYIFTGIAIVIAVIVIAQFIIGTVKA